MSSDIAISPSSFAAWTVATSLAVGASTVLTVYGVALLTRRRALRARLASVAGDAAVLPEDGQPRQRAMLTIAEYIGRVVRRFLPPPLVRRLQLATIRAGLTNRNSTEILLGLRAVVILSVAGLAYAFATSGHGALGSLGAVLIVGLGGFGTDLYLRSRAQARRRAAERDLPTVLDLLMLTLAAGLGFDNALEMILVHFKGPLVDELNRYLVEIRTLGARRTTALRDVALRLGDPPDLVDFVDAVNRAQQMGTGMLAAVESQVQMLRRERHRRVASAAQRAPVRMLIPMTLFMLPVLMLIVLAPVGLRVMNATGGLH